MYLVLVPAFHNGSKPIDCSRDHVYDEEYDEAWLYGGEDPGRITYTCMLLIFSCLGCGVIPDEDVHDYAYEDHVPNRGDKTHILTTLDDGSKYQDFTYQVIAEYNEYSTNLDEGKPQLTVELGGEVKQVLSVPQSDGVVQVDPDNYTKDYLFGCFRPQLGIVDTRGAGFHEYAVDNMKGRQIYYSYDLCKALLDWPGTPGYNY